MKYTSVFIINDTQLVVADTMEEAVKLYRENTIDTDAPLPRDVKQLHAGSSFDVNPEDYYAMIKDENS